jgi:type IV/VI secretion system ImpK/VasF family protein
METVRALFARLFDYVLLFQQLDFHHEPHPSYAQVRSTIATLLAQQAAAAQEQGMLADDAQEARFAVVAWADEMILQQTAWEHHQQWRSFPLQLEYFETRKAGEELFERLDRLRPEQTAVREIYYLCLGLGFRGCYFLGLEDERRLAQLRHTQARRLALPIETVQSLERLTPQPYQVSLPPGRPLTPSLPQRLLTVGLALLIAAPLTLLITYTAFPWATPRSLPPSPAEVTQALASSQQGCTAVAVDTVEARTGHVSLTGYVVNATQRAQVRQSVQRLPGVMQVQDTLQILPPLLCEVVALLKPWHHAAATTPAAVSMQLDKGQHPLYTSGDNMVIALRTPGAFASHVYVDYYNADGSIRHLLPNPHELTNTFGPATFYTVGRLDGPQPWQIAPPCGIELVTVIASTTPLFATPRLEVEPGASYLATLRQALAQRQPSEIAGTFHVLMTRE